MNARWWKTSSRSSLTRSTGLLNLVVKTIYGGAQPVAKRSTRRGGRKWWDDWWENTVLVICRSSTRANGCTTHREAVRGELETGEKTGRRERPD
jgi:hypothetical protein